MFYLATTDRVFKFDHIPETQIGRIGYDGLRPFIHAGIETNQIAYTGADPLTRSPQLIEGRQTQSVQQRLDNANRHSRRKAADVLADEDAVRLLADMYQSVNIAIDEFDAREHGVALARLTAANFCEIGAMVIYITEAGQRFIEALDTE